MENKNCRKCIYYFLHYENMEYGFCARHIKEYNKGHSCEDFNLNLERKTDRLLTLYSLIEYHIKSIEDIIKALNTIV